jgi:ATP adenylyltransferase/5',5'''-P-1,P-4-tetraphosphate phosphorylase II
MTTTETQNFEIENGLIGMKKYTIIKIVEIIAMNKYNKGKKEIENDYSEPDEEYSLHQTSFVETDSEGNEYIINKFQYMLNYQK